MKVSRYKEIESARTKYLSDVDNLASEIRGQHITSGIGQTASYDRKEKQARDFIAGESSTFNWLELEAAETETTVETVANTIIAQADAWDAAASQIEGYRIGAKHQIRNALTVREMYDAMTVAQTKMEQVSNSVS